MFSDYLGMTDPQLISAVGAFFLPLLIALFQDSTWSDRVRYTVSLVTYIAYAFVSLWFLNYLVFNYDTTAHDVFRAFLVAAVIGYGSFKLVWQPAGTTFKLERNNTALNYKKRYDS